MLLHVSQIATLVGDLPILLRGMLERTEPQMQVLVHLLIKQCLPVIARQEIYRSQAVGLGRQIEPK
jgi:hypothetical protein